MKLIDLQGVITGNVVIYGVKENPIFADFNWALETYHDWYVSEIAPDGLFNKCIAIYCFKDNANSNETESYSADQYLNSIYGKFASTEH